MNKGITNLAYLESSCAPFALYVVQKPKKRNLKKTMKACQKYKWSSRDGMTIYNIRKAAKELGISLWIRRSHYNLEAASKLPKATLKKIKKNPLSFLTLTKVFPTLGEIQKKFVKGVYLVCTMDHVSILMNGEFINEVKSRRKKCIYLYEVKM